MERGKILREVKPDVIDAAVKAILPFGYQKRFVFSTGGGDSGYRKRKTQGR